MALQPHELKALAIELAAAMPPAPASSLHEVLAQAFALSAADRAVLEGYLRSTRTAGIEFAPESFRQITDDEARRLLHG